MKTKHFSNSRRINKLLLILVLIVANCMLPAAKCFSQAWTQKADFGGRERSGAACFIINSKLYVGLGYNYFNSPQFKKDFWEYDPATNIWTQKADFEGTARSSSVCFSIGNKGYIGTGGDGITYYKDFWEYDPVTDTWLQKADFGGTPRIAVGFSIGNKGYIGIGKDSNGYKNDFWEYDPTTDTWTQKENFGGTARSSLVGFFIGNKGYIGTGYDGVSYYKDFWEYDPATDTWTQKADFGGTSRNGAGFSIENKGYIGTGFGGTGIYYNDFWEYEPITDTWTQKAIFPGAARCAVVGFSILNKGYIGTGFHIHYPEGYPVFFMDFWEYNQVDDTTTLNELKEQDIKFQIVPNPNNGVFKIQYNLSENTYLLVEIYNIYGQLVKNDLFNNLSGYHELIINAEGIGSGIYVVKVSSNTLNKSFKIEIKK